MAGKVRWSKVAHVMAARKQKRWGGLDPIYLPPQNLPLVTYFSREVLLPRVPGTSFNSWVSDPPTLSLLEGHFITPTTAEVLSSPGK